MREIMMNGIINQAPMGGAQLGAAVVEPVSD
jgi:hypothetical protein